MAAVSQIRLQIVVVVISPQVVKSKKYLRLKSAKLQKRIETAYEDKCDGSITQAQYDDYRTKWRAQQKLYERKLARLTTIDEQYYVTVAYLLEIAKHGAELFKGADPNEKRELIGLLGSNLFLDGKKVEITLYKPFSDIASCVNRSTWLTVADALRTASAEYDEYQVQNIQSILQYKALA